MHLLSSSRQMTTTWVELSPRHFQNLLFSLCLSSWKRLFVAKWKLPHLSQLNPGRQCQCAQGYRLRSARRRTSLKFCRASFRKPPKSSWPWSQGFLCLLLPDFFPLQEPLLAVWKAHPIPLLSELPLYWTSDLVRASSRFRNASHNWGSSSSPGGQLLGLVLQPLSFISCDWFVLQT